MSFEFDKRTRKKVESQVGALLPPGTTVREVAACRAHGRWTVTTTLAAMFVPWILIDRFVCPNRAVVECDEGMALIGLTILGNRPRAVVALVDHNPLAWVQSANTRRVHIGPDVVKFSKKEYQRIAELQGRRTAAAITMA